MHYRVAVLQCQKRSKEKQSTASLSDPFHFPLLLSNASFGKTNLLHLQQPTMRSLKLQSLEFLFMYTLMPTSVKCSFTTIGTNNATSSIEALGIWSNENAQIDLRDLCTFNFHLTIVVKSLKSRQQRKTRFLRMSFQLITF